MSAVLLRTESASSSQIEDLTVGARQLALAMLDESRSGNGRTGRALVHALLSGKGLLTTTAPVSAGLLTDLEA